MKIEKLKLTNFRGARDLTLDLSPNLEVFYGENGAGKSTVIDAIARMLTWLVNRLQRAGSSGKPVLEEEITNGQGSAVIEIWGRDRERSICWQLAKQRKGQRELEQKSNLNYLNDYVKQLHNEVPFHSLFASVPVFVYYPVNRSVVDIPLRIKGRHTFDIWSTYDESLTRAANFRTFFEWFRECEDQENEINASRKAAVKHTDFRLEAVRQALTAFLPEFRNFRVRRTPLRMEVDKNGKTLNVCQLSDGEKCLIALVGDLARRLAIANSSISHMLKDEDLLQGAGVVLIDEVDLHLHPTWQRLIVPGLLKTFPNCQFILSTHSPHVITHVQPENLYMLKQSENGMTAERPNESYGKTVDRILEDLMGLTTTRPDDVNKILQEIFLAIDKRDIKLAGKLIEGLDLTLRNDPEIIKAEALIRRMEIIGK